MKHRIVVNNANKAFGCLLPGDLAAESPYRVLEVEPQAVAARILDAMYQHKSTYYGLDPEILILGLGEALSLGLELAKPCYHPEWKWDGKPPSEFQGMRIVISGVSGIAFGWSSTPHHLLWELAQMADAKPFEPVT